MLEWLLNLVKGFGWWNLLIVAVLGFIVFKVISEAVKLALKIAVVALLVVVIFLAVKYQGVPIISLNSGGVGPSMGQNMAEYFLYDYQKPLLTAAAENCYLGEATYQYTLDYTKELNTEYQAGRLTSKQMWQNLSNFNNNYLPLIKTIKTDCIPTDQIPAKIKALQDVELELATKYYSGFSPIQIELEKLKVRLAFDLFVKSKVPFEVAAA